ncbi:MAG: transglycosylase domain-containing protein, partial [Bacteroidetes bacterium]|nr:transglycosylase domain-containing protein [Bacteroidota bacterium]
MKRETQKQNLPRFLPLDSYLEAGVQVRAAQAPPPLSSDTYRESGRIERSELEQKTQLKEWPQTNRTVRDRPHDPGAGHDADSHHALYSTPIPPRKATSRATPPWLTGSDFESENAPAPPKQLKPQLPEFRPTSHSSFQTVSQTATEPKARKEKRTGNLIRLTSRILVVAALLSGIVASAYVYDYVSKIEAGLPVLPVSPALREPVSSIILAADGSEIARLYKERRQWITLEEMSPNVVDALIAMEDHRFFQHAGVDYFRLVGAAWNTLTGKLQGASTIPMQMARNAFPDVASSSAIDRKIKEIILARRLESRFSKEEILEWYLNTVSFGNNSFGIEAAAVTYFSKHAAELQLEEAALLVGMLKGPSRYDPRLHGSLSRERRNLVLQRMEETGKISMASFRRAASSPLLLNLTFYNPADSPAPFFTEYVRRVAQNWALRNGYDLYRDGLIIHTTLDADLQKLAELAVRSQMEILQRIVNSEWSQRRIPVTTGSTISASPFQYFWSTHRILESELIKKSTRYRRALERGVQATVALAELLGNPSFIDSLQTAASRLDAGLVAIDPHTGQIRAWVGGRDFSIDQYDKVASARRQPGSTFKPFLYAAAIEKGFSPYYLVEDRVRTFRTGPRGEVWRPTNAGGGASGRLVSLRQGLAWSKNTVSAHLIRRIGPQSVVRLAKNMGI